MCPSSANADAFVVRHARSHSLAAPHPPPLMAAPAKGRRERAQSSTRRGENVTIGAPSLRSSTSSRDLRGARCLPPPVPVVPVGLALATSASASASSVGRGSGGSKGGSFFGSLALGRSSSSSIEPSLLSPADSFSSFPSPSLSNHGTPLLGSLDLGSLSLSREFSSQSSSARTDSPIFNTTFSEAQTARLRTSGTSASIKSKASFFIKRASAPQPASGAASSDDDELWGTAIESATSCYIRELDEDFHSDTGQEVDGDSQNRGQLAKQRVWLAFTQAEKDATHGPHNPWTGAHESELTATDLMLSGHYGNFHPHERGCIYLYNPAVGYRLPDSGRSSCFCPRAVLLHAHATDAPDPSPAPRPRPTKLAANRVITFTFVHPHVKTLKAHQNMVVKRLTCSTLRRTAYACLTVAEAVAAAKSSPAAEADEAAARAEVALPRWELKDAWWFQFGQVGKPVRNDHELAMLFEFVGEQAETITLEVVSAEQAAGQAV